MVEQPTFLPTLPNRLPDEWYPSFIYRLHLLGGLPTVERSVLAIFGQPLNLSHFAPTGVAELAKRIPPSYGLNTETFLAENTIFPYLRPFAFKNTPSEFQHNFVHDSPRATKNYLLPGRRAGLGKREPRFCVSCMSDDTEQWGFPYFHRSHQVPEVVVCVRHGVPLRSSCLECGSFAWPPYRLWPAGSCRRCGADLQAQGSDPSVVFTNILADLRIAQLITQFLDANLPLLDVATLHATYRVALKRNDFLTSRNALKVGEFAAAVSERFGDGYLEELGLPVKISSIFTPRWAALILSKTPSVRPLEHCLAIFFLFGSFDNFIEEYQNSGRLQEPPLSVPPELTSYSETKESTHAWMRSAEIPVPIVRRKSDSPGNRDDLEDLRACRYT